MLAPIRQVHRGQRPRGLSQLAEARPQRLLAANTDDEGSSSTTLLRGERSKILPLSFRRPTSSATRTVPNFSALGVTASCRIMPSRSSRSRAICFARGWLGPRALRANARRQRMQRGGPADRCEAVGGPWITGMPLAPRTKRVRHTVARTQRISPTATTPASVTSMVTARPPSSPCRAVTSSPGEPPSEAGLPRRSVALVV